MVGTLDAAPREEARSRFARLLARRRAWIFAPLFLAAVALAYFREAAPLPRSVVAPAVATVLACWLLRIWATGYRTWVHNDGAARYLMSAGPYAYLRHPLYVANGLAGAAALVVMGQLELLAVYSVAYLGITALIVRREEEALDRRFGEDHASYRARVPAFCPLPGRAQPRSERRGSFTWEPVHRSLELLKLAVIVGLAAWVLVR